METFSALLVLCAGNSPVSGEVPAQRPVTRSLMFSLICAWINAWVSNHEAGDLRRYRAHYDVTVMEISESSDEFRVLASNFIHIKLWSVPHPCIISNCHYNDVIMGAIASQITSLTIVYSAVYLGANERKHQKSASLAFVRGIHRWQVHSPHKWPVTRLKVFIWWRHHVI